MKQLFPSIIFMCALLCSCNSSLMDREDITLLTTVTGHVADSIGDPLPDVDVFLIPVSPGDTIKTATTASGDFKFSKINQGQYLIFLEKDGFETISANVSFANDKEHLTYVMEQLPALSEIKVQPETLSFDSAESLTITLTATVRTSLQWSVAISDSTWLSVAPDHGTMTPPVDSRILTFSVDHSKILRPSFQIVKIIVGETPMPLIVSCGP